MEALLRFFRIPIPESAPPTEVLRSGAPETETPAPSPRRTLPGELLGRGLEREPAADWPDTPREERAGTGHEHAGENGHA